MSSDWKSYKAWVPRIRRSQLITTFGPGAVIDLSRDSAMPMALDHWEPRIPDEEDKIREPRLEEALGVHYFRQPPPFREGEREDKIPIVKFPSYHFCPACNQLTNDFTRDERRKDGVRCTNPDCKVWMTPARFIAACADGHAQDFPFRQWAHWGDADGCRRQLSMRIRGESTGLRDVWINCACGEGRSMSGAFGQDALQNIGVTCDGLHPWKGEGVREECEAPLRTLLRASSNFYFPEMRSSLSIPPWEGKVSRVIQDFRQMSGVRWPEHGNADHKAALRLILNREKYEEIDTRDVFEWIDDHDPSETGYDIQRFKREEFTAFTRLIPSTAPRPKWRIRSEDIPDILNPYVGQIVIADVLEEVRAIHGYRRIEPRPEGLGEEGDEEDNLVTIREDDVPWLPAVRITGEGIFIRFRTEPLDEWAASGHMPPRLEELITTMERDEGTDWRAALNINGRLLFLHSFAHILMKQMSLECGYSSGALRERIYAGDPQVDGEEDMAGVLIYTGSTDSEGTLGGLVRMGAADELGPLVARAVERTSWCSSDPVCSETTNPGERTRNLCACHACMFVPETSCEYFNSLLDRHAVIGDLEGRGGYLSDLI